MKIELKKIKIGPMNRRNGGKMTTAELHVDGKFVASIEDRANGGELYIYPEEGWDIINRVKAELNKRPSQWGDSGMTFDEFFADTCDNFENDRAMERKTKTMLVFYNEGLGEVRVKKFEKGVFQKGLTFERGRQALRATADKILKTLPGFVLVNKNL